MWKGWNWSFVYMEGIQYRQICRDASEKPGTQSKNQHVNEPVCLRQREETNKSCPRVGGIKWWALVTKMEQMWLKCPCVCSRVWCPVVAVARNVGGWEVWGCRRKHLDISGCTRDHGAQTMLQAAASAKLNLSGILHLKGLVHCH